MIVFFDDECLMCQASLKWLNRLDSDDRLLFAPLRGETASRFEIDRAKDSIAVAEGGRVWRSSEALRLACLRAGGPGVLVAGFLILIPMPLREWGYRLIAGNRKKFLKGSSCGLPEEGMREKMRD